MLENFNIFLFFQNLIYSFSHILSKLNTSFFKIFFILQFKQIFTIIFIKQNKYHIIDNN